MALKDALDSAKTRIERAKSKEQEEARVLQNYRDMIQSCIGASIRRAAISAYQAICIAVADEIYATGNRRHLRVKGHVELNDCLKEFPFYETGIKIPIEKTQAYRELFSYDFGDLAKRAAEIHSAIPCFGVRGEYEEYYCVRLFEPKGAQDARAGVLNLSRAYSMKLTQRGRELALLVQKLAQKDGIQVQPAILCVRPRAEDREGERGARIFPLQHRFRRKSLQDYFDDCSVVFQYVYDSAARKV